MSDKNIDKEVWKDIKGYEGKYQVSNLGNVKSLQYKRLGKERILIPYISNRGYYTVALSMNSKKAVRTIHRLVAETFVENIEDLPMVNHIDGNKKNNRADNLEWCTQKHNVRHAWENGLAKKDNTQTIYQFDLRMNFIKKYKNQTEASKETGIKQSEISKCCNDLRSKTGDYIWCYDDKILSELETYKKIAEKPTIEFAKELNKASLVMLDGRFIGGERERVLRFYKPEDIGVDIKVNEVGKDVQLNEKIFHSGKHFLELKFYHNESIDALIHRLEHLKTL